MVTEKETEAMIDKTAAGFAQLFVDAFPLGFIEDAVHREITYIGRISSLFEERLRELIPYAFDPDEFAAAASTSLVPVLEGVVVVSKEPEDNEIENPPAV